MKLSKTLLNTIVVAVTLGTISSCTKSVDDKPVKKAIQKIIKSEPTPQNCPACGMG